MTNKRLAILSTHPIQYHAPWFRGLARQPGLNIDVLYCHQATAQEQANAGFGVDFNWDISLLDGYPHRFLKNVASKPGIARFSGLNTPEIKDIIAGDRFDAVMINGWHYRSAWQAMRACWKTKTPVMVRSDSHLHTTRTGLKRAAKVPFYRWFISMLDACLPVGKWSTDYFLHYGASPERVLTLPHVIDTDYFGNESKRLRSQRTAIRESWNLDETSVVFLFAGKFTEKKRPLDFVRGLNEARARGAQVSGLMVGDGPLRAICEAEVHTSNLPIKFAGFLNQSEIVRAYTAADSLVLPSDGGETWGLVVNEAMSCGLPCFISDKVGCGPDLVKTPLTGGIFPVGDFKALGNLMSAFAADNEQMKCMSEEVRKQAQQYSVTVGIERTVQAVEMVSK